MFHLAFRLSRCEVVALTRTNQVLGQAWRRRLRRGGISLSTSQSMCEHSDWRPSIQSFSSCSPRWTAAVRRDIALHLCTGAYERRRADWSPPALLSDAETTSRSRTMRMPTASDQPAHTTGVKYQSQQVVGQPASASASKCGPVACGAATR